MVFVFAPTPGAYSLVCSPGSENHKSNQSNGLVITMGISEVHNVMGIREANNVMDIRLSLRRDNIYECDPEWYTKCQYKNTGA